MIFIKTPMLNREMSRKNSYELKESKELKKEKEYL